MRELAKQSGLSLTAIFRHKQHIASANGAPIRDIASEIVKLRNAQARAKRKGDTSAVLSISREIRAWLALEAKSENVIAGKMEETQEMSRDEAVRTAVLLIEAELARGTQEVISWVLAVAERVNEERYAMETAEAAPIEGESVG
jgi:hypothetical protein